MAENPEILVQGTISRVQTRTKYTEDPNAEREPNGREVGILAKTGFLTVRVPLGVDFQINEGDEVLWSLDYNNWSFEQKSGEVKTGTTLTFKHALRTVDLAALEAAIAKAPKAA